MRTVGADLPCDKYKYRPLPAALGLFLSTLYPRCLLENIAGRGPGLLIRDKQSFGQAFKGGYDGHHARHKTQVLNALRLRQVVYQLEKRLSHDNQDASDEADDNPASDGGAHYLAPRSCYKSKGAWPPPLF